MAIARKVGIPGWVKWGLGGFGLLILLGIGMIALGHNPLDHMTRHLGG